MVLRMEQMHYERAPTGAGEDRFALVVENLSLRAGEALGVTGPSGCGKSTLVDLFGLLRRPRSAGLFELMGVDVAGLWSAGRVDQCSGLRARAIGVVLQTGGLLPSLSVFENVMLPQRLLGLSGPAHAKALLDALDLSSLGGRLPSQLSIGQRQRVAIARALSHRPALVLADEPTASLGVEHAGRAMDLLLSLCDQHGSALVVVSHDTAMLRARGLPLLSCRLLGGLMRVERESAHASGLSVS